MPITSYGLENAKALSIVPERFKQLDKKVNDWVNDGTHPVFAAKVLRYGKPIYEGVYGKSYTDPPTDVTMDDIFPLASITKPIVSVLLSILQEDGEVDIGSTVKNYYTEYGRNGRDEITICHLLTHTSGYEEEKMSTNIQEYIEKTLGLVKPDSETVTEESWDIFTVHKEGVPTAFGRFINIVYSALEK